MPFETRQVDGKDVQYYVAPSKELPTVLNSKPIETPTATQEPVPFDSSDELNVFDEGEFSGFDWNSGFDGSTLLDNTPEIDFNYTPPTEAESVLIQNNITTQEDLTKYLDSLSFEDRLETQKTLQPILQEGSDGILNDNFLGNWVQSQAYKTGWQGSGARVTQSLGNYVADTVPSNIRMLAGTPAYGGDFRADTLSWQQDTGKPWAIDFLGVGKRIWGKEIPYLNAPLPEGANRESLNSVPFWKQLLQSSTVVDSALLSLIGQDSSNTPGANIDGQFLDQLQIQELGVKSFELTTRGDDAYNRQTTGSYAQLIPWNLAIPKSKANIEELLALGYREDQIFERYDGEHWVVGPIRPGDLMDQKGMDVNPELILERDDSGKLIDIRYGGRSYTAGLSGTQSILGIETKRSDWQGYNFYEPDQIYLGKDRAIQAFVEQSAGPLALNLAAIVATKKPLKAAGISPHLPGAAKYSRMIETGRRLRTTSPVLSSAFRTGAVKSFVGHTGLAATEYGFSSMLVGFFVNNPQGQQGGTMLPELAEAGLGENNLITKLLSPLSVSGTDSTAVGNLKVAVEDFLLGAFVGIPIDFAGVGLRGLKNAPSFWGPSIDMKLTPLFRQRFGKGDFNWDDFSSGKYDSIFSRLDKGITNQLSLETDDLRAIATLKKDLQPVLTKLSNTIVNGARLEALQTRLARLNQLNRTDISVVKPKKSYTRGESGASQAEPGSPWRQFTETNQRKPLWETPYSEQKEIELTQNKEQLKEEVKTVEQEIVETESRLGESMEEVEEVVVRAQESVTPPQKQSLVEQGVDPNFAPPVPSEIQKLPVTEIDVAPQYFQVKRSGREAKAGVSGSLAGAGQFEPILGGVVSVWRDRQGQIGEAGKIYIVDGHNRLDLAKRSGTEAIDVRFIQVETPSEARQVAAMQNVAQSQSTVGGLQALDVADYLREEGASLDDFAAKGLNLRNSLVEEAVQLQRLPDFLYKKFKAGEIDKTKAFAYGSVEGIPPEVITDLYKIASKGRWGAPKIEQAMFMARNATVAIEEGVIPGLSSYFKNSDIKQLLAARVEVTKQLQARARTLKTASNLEQAAILEGVEGTTINIKGSQTQRLQARLILNTFNQLAGLDGEVTALLKDVASEIKGRNVKALVEERLPEIINALKVESQGRKPPKTELTKTIEKQVETRTKKRNEVQAKQIEQRVQEPPNQKTIQAEQSQGILDTVPTSDKTLDRVPKKIQETLNKIKQEQQGKELDPWDTIDAKDQTLEIEGERVDEPIREFFTTKEGSDLIEGKDIPSSELVPVSEALGKVDPRTPLSFFIRSAPKGEQAKIAIDRLVEAFDKFSETAPGGLKRIEGLGPVNTVGDLLNLLNIGRVAIEEGVQKGLRDAETTEAFRRQIAPYLTKASKLAIERAMADIEKVQIYLKALQFEIEGKLKGARDKILEAGEEADRELERIDEWEMPKFLSNTLKRLGYEDISNRVYFEKSPTFNDSKTPRVKFGRPKPTYAQGRTKMDLEFESDVDLAIYIVTSGKPSKSRALYVEWLESELGIPPDYYTARGELMRLDMAENLVGGGVYRVEDTRSWENRSYIEYMTFDIEDERAAKAASKNDKELLRQLKELQNPKRPPDELAPKDDVDFQVDGKTPELPWIPRNAAQFGDRYHLAALKGPLTEARIQAILEGIVKKMAPYVKVDQPIAYMASKKDIGKKHAGVEKTDELQYVAGFHDPIRDLVMIARYMGSHPRSLSERIWTAYHEAWHSVMRRHMTKGEFRLLLEGKKELEAIAARVRPDKADIILSGKYAFSEVTAYAASGWGTYSKYVLKKGAPDPTWAQPLQKMRRLIKAVKRFVFGLMDGDKPAYKTWDEVFEAGMSGELGARGIVQAKNKFQRSYWMGGDENRFYEFGPNYNQRQEGIEYEPATDMPDASDIPEKLERIQKRIEEGNISFREAVFADNQSTIRRAVSRSGKTLYFGMDARDLGIANKVLEDTVVAHYGGREGFTGIDKINLEAITKMAREQLRGSNFDIETTIRLYEEARGGNIKSQQDLITHVALLLHRDQNLFVLKELALEARRISEGMSEADKLDIANRLTAVFQNQLMLDQAFVSATRKWGQIGRATQLKAENIEPALPTGMPITKQLNKGDVEMGLKTENGIAGEGAYFTASTSADGFTGSLPSDVLIVDLPTTGRSLSDFMQDINLDAPKDGFNLSKAQKDGLRTWAADNNYSGIRFEGKDGEDIVVVFDMNNANRIIDSDVARFPVRDGQQPSMRSLFEEAALKSGKLLEKKLTPDLSAQLKSGKFSPELEAVIDEIARAVFNLGNSTEIEAKFYMEDLSDLITSTPNGKLTQRAITNYIRNAQFMRASTFAKVLGGGAFRAATIPMQQYVGAWHEKRRHTKAWLESGKTDDNSLYQAKSAAYRMKLNKKLLKLYAHEIPNMMRLGILSFKHDEVFVNLHRGFFEDARDPVDVTFKRKEGLNVNEQRMRDYQEVGAGEMEYQSRLSQEFEYRKRTLRKKPTGDEWYLKPTSTWTALAWKYISEALSSGARRGMGSMDTFLNAMVGPPMEKIRLMEMEVNELTRKGEELTPRKELEIENRVNEQLKKLWVDIEINGEIVKDGYFDSEYAKNAMDYINFTDDIDVDMAKKTYEYGVRKAMDKGLTNNAEIVRYAEDYVDGKIVEMHPNAYQGPAKDQVEGAFAFTRKAINTPAAALKFAESRLPILGSFVLTNRTPLNIAKGTVRYTGFGQHIIDSAWRDINHEDLFIRERALGEYSTGVLLLTTGLGLLATGHVQLSGPEPLGLREREERKNLGVQSNSIRFKGLSGDWTPWYNIEMFDAASTIWGVLGSYVEGMKKIPVEEYGNLEMPGDQAIAHAGIHIAAMKYAIGQGLTGQLTKSTMQSYKAVADLIQSFAAKDDFQSGRSGLGAGQASLEKLLAKFIPGFITAGAQQIDPIRRQISETDINTGIPLVDPILETLVNTIKEVARKTPYLSRTQPPQLHPTKGTPLVYDGAIGLKTAENLAPFGDITKFLFGAFSPTGAVRQLTQSTDAVDLEFAKLYGKGGNFTIYSRRMMDIPSGDGNKRQMTQNEFNELITIATQEVEIGGMKMHEYLTWVITKDPQYNALPSPVIDDVDLEGNPVDYRPPSKQLIHPRVEYLQKVINWYINGGPGETRVHPISRYKMGSAKQIWMERHPDIQEEKARIQGIADVEKSLISFDTSTYGPQASLEQWRLLTADPIT